MQICNYLCQTANRKWPFRRRTQLRVQETETVFQCKKGTVMLRGSAHSVFGPGTDELTWHYTHSFCSHQEQLSSLFSGLRRKLKLGLEKFYSSYCTHIHAHTHTQTRTYTHTHIHKHAHKRTRTYTQTHTNGPVSNGALPLLLYCSL